jgi:hypothetical protein
MKWAIISEYCLLLEPGNNRLKPGERKNIAEKFVIDDSSAGKIVRDQRANGVIVPDLEPKRKRKCGRELQHDDGTLPHRV